MLKRKRFICRKCNDIETIFIGKEELPPECCDTPMEESIGNVMVIYNAPGTYMFDKQMKDGLFYRERTGTKFISEAHDKTRESNNRVSKSVKQMQEVENDKFYGTKPEDFVCVPS